MSNFYRLTIPAQQDLNDISQFIANRNIDAAIRLVDKITQKFETLAKFPNLGKSRAELFPGLRSFPLEDYLIFYRLIDGGIEIVRVVSGYRDVEALFENVDGS